MAEICYGVVSDGEASPPCEPSSRAARRRRMEIRRFKIVAGVATSPENSRKRQRTEASLSPRECSNAIETCDESSGQIQSGRKVLARRTSDSYESQMTKIPLAVAPDDRVSEWRPVFGMLSVCGRRRDMEDAVSVLPSFFRFGRQIPAPEFHFFGVYDGHGCSHVAASCKERLHQLVAEELESIIECGIFEPEWKEVMEKSFKRMDMEATGGVQTGTPTTNCRCELQTPHCDAVGSTAVVAVVAPSHIVVANCGDSRAVLCRGGEPVALSSDHKPDRPDELLRIQASGGRVIYWDGPRVLGVLAMSRAIGDNYLKPYVSSEPEVTVTERAAEDECLILASDGLWDVVSNEVACEIARRCLQRAPENGASSSGVNGSDPACSVAAALLTKLALARQSTDNVSVVVIDLKSAHSHGRAKLGGVQFGVKR
ncbi:hypothetical protein AMTRI_Chr08g161680 [Amborella trichopoda]